MYPPLVKQMVLMQNSKISTLWWVCVERIMSDARAQINLQQDMFGHTQVHQMYQETFNCLTSVKRDILVTTIP